MDRAAAAIVTALALFYAWCVHPAWCWPNIVGDPLYDGAGGFPERGRQSDALIEGQIYCTGGARPIVVDDRTVGCQR